MPHSSGGGSHGGGFHGGGGSHGGSGGNRVSNHYFTGARRYIRHHRRTGLDEYVYATSKPQRASLFSIIIIVVVGLIFLVGIGAGTRPQLPKALNGPFYETAIYDDADIFGNEDVLKNTLTEYYGLTGICPVIYSVYDETWQNSYSDLESYAFSTYVNNFVDEQHFVIVYSVPENEAALVKEGKLDIPNYSWEAIQGDDTDLILTEGMFRRFGKLVQNDLESGADPGVAFDNAFKFAINDAESILKPFSFSRVVKTVRSLIPMLLVGGIIVPMLILSVKQYIRDRDVEYEEVPLDGNETTSYSRSSGITGGAAGGYAQSSGYSGTWTKGAQTASIAGVIFGMVFVTPFVLSGLGMIIGSFVMFANGDKNGGGFLLIFGILWALISVFILVSMILTFFRIKKNAQDRTPLTAEYPQAEYPHADYPRSEYPQADYPGADSPDMNNDDPVAAFVPLKDQPSPFVPLKSNIEDDDEDYKRMKRKGFE
ncbi:MAG: hypothetical protein K6E72_12315 [Saccharofermentans sp.]|nr:hypothetical protein [Saccharofermentans sp.]